MFRMMSDVPRQALARPEGAPGSRQLGADDQKFFPKKKQVVICNFVEAIKDSDCPLRDSDCPLRGFVPPEIIKTRPVVVLSNVTHGLYIVVALSTTQPKKLKSFHYQIDWDPPLQGWETKPCAWAKGDMIYTVSYKRLRGLQNSQGKTTPRFLTETEWEGIVKAVQEALKL